MKIAFFIWEFYPRLVGGLGVYGIEVTKKFVEMGHEVAVFTLNDGNLPTYEIWNEIEIHRPLIVDSSYIFPVFVREDLKKWGKNIKFFSDIFSYNYLAATKFVNLLVKKQKRDFDIVAYHDWLSAFSGIIVQKNVPELPTVFHVHSIEEQRSLGLGSQTVKDIERFAAKDSNKIITVSYSMKDFLIQLGYPAEKISVVYNGIDVEKYNPKNVNWELVDKLREMYGIRENEKVVFYIGRLTWIKGVYNLVKAIPLVLNEFPNTKFIILGKGESFDDLLALAQQLKLIESNKVVIRSEWISEEERIAHYALADLCVFPSLSEPFGIVSLEAMAMKKPLVVGAAGVSGFREQVIPDGPDRTGVHINGADPNDIAWGIKVILSNLEKAKKWGENGRKRVIENFTIEKTAKKTLSIYEEISKR